MPLIEFAREVFPRFYWSAGFIAVLFAVVILAAILYVVTKWSPWLMVALAGGLYLIPFIFGFAMR